LYATKKEKRKKKTMRENKIGLIDLFNDEEKEK
jgi:hypothetical protein